MRFRKGLYIIISVLSTIGLSACKQFQPISLYDGEETRVKEAESDAIIYKESLGTLWSSMGDCGSVVVTDEVEAQEGNKCLRIMWDKSKGCEWVGLGNSWNNWAPTDISEDLERKAVSFYIRTIEGEVGGAGIVVALDDMSETGAYIFADSKKYLRGLRISEEWKQMVIPFWDFPYARDEADYYAIKQMKFQFEGGGRFYVDNIEIINYTKEDYAKDREWVESLKPKGEPEQDLYTAKIGDAVWGLGTTMCQTFIETSNNDRSDVLSWKWNANDCGWAKWELNWNNWDNINMRKVDETMELQLDVYMNKMSTFNMNLKDFKYNSTSISVSPEQHGIKNNEWKTISIDIGALELKKKGFVLDQIRGFEFVGVGDGDVMIDNIRLVQKN